MAGTELENTHVAKSLLFLERLLKKAGLSERLWGRWQVIRRGGQGLQALEALLARSVQSARLVLKAQKPCLGRRSRWN